MTVDSRDPARPAANGSIPDVSVLGALPAPQVVTGARCFSCASAAQPRPTTPTPSSASNCRARPASTPAPASCVCASAPRARARPPTTARSSARTSPPDRRRRRLVPGPGGLHGQPRAPLRRRALDIDSIRTAPAGIARAAVGVNAACAKLRVRACHVRMHHGIRAPPPPRRTPFPTARVLSASGLGSRPLGLRRPPRPGLACPRRRRRSRPARVRGGARAPPRSVRPGGAFHDGAATSRARHRALAARDVRPRMRRVAPMFALAPAIV